MTNGGNKLIVWVDAIPDKARDRISTVKQYLATKIHDSKTAYEITDDNGNRLIINPDCDKHNLNGMAWHKGVVA